MARLLFDKNPLSNNKATAAALKLIAAEKKKGRTKEQCKCIDFFYSVDDGGKKKGCFSSVTKPMTMDQYLTYVDGLANSLNIKERAIEKIGLDESEISEIEPINLASFVRKGDGVEVKYENMKIGKLIKPVMVSNKYSTTWIFFSQKQIYTYTYIFDTLTDSIEEYTRDFFYRDITCIRTEHEIESTIYERVEGCGCLSFLRKKESKYYNCMTHFDTLQITVPNDAYSFCCRSDSFNEKTYASIMAIKAMIREKKDQYEKTQY